MSEENVSEMRGDKERRGERRVSCIYLTLVHVTWIPRHMLNQGNIYAYSHHTIHLEIGFVYVHARQNPW